jgi:hypothetical protein
MAHWPLQEILTLLEHKFILDEFPLAFLLGQIVIEAFKPKVGGSQRLHLSLHHRLCLCGCDLYEY